MCVHGVCHVESSTAQMFELAFVSIVRVCRVLLVGARVRARVQV